MALEGGRTVAARGSRGRGRGLARWALVVEVEPGRRRALCGDGALSLVPGGPRRRPRRCRVTPAAGLRARGRSDGIVRRRGVAGPKRELASPQTTTVEGRRGGSAGVPVGRRFGQRGPATSHGPPWTAVLSSMVEIQRGAVGPRQSSRPCNALPACWRSRVRPNWFRGRVDTPGPAVRRVICRGVDQCPSPPGGARRAGCPRTRLELRSSISTTATRRSLREPHLLRRRRMGRSSGSAVVALNRGAVVERDGWSPGRTGWPVTGASEPHRQGCALGSGPTCACGFVVMPRASPR